MAITPGSPVEHDIRENTGKKDENRCAPFFESAERHSSVTDTLQMRIATAIDLLLRADRHDQCADNERRQGAACRQQARELLAGDAVPAPDKELLSVLAPDDNEEEREYQELLSEIRESEEIKIRFDHCLSEEHTARLLEYASSDALRKNIGAVIEPALVRANRRFYDLRDIAKTRLKMKRGKNGKSGSYHLSSDQ